MDVALFRDTSSGPRRPKPTGQGGGPGDPPGKEPMFNAPWPALLLVASIIGGYALQSRFPIDMVVAAGAFYPAALGEGRWATLVTALFLHGGWGHALMNGAFALAFAAAVSRFFGERLLGVVSFFAFYLTCGVLANLAYAALHPGGLEPLVGASGAVSGLMAAGARLLAGHGWLGPIRSRMVLGMGAAWVGLNLLIGLIGSAFLPGTGGAGVAWEAHIAGFLAGLVLVRPFAWLAHRA
ncbi:rhomboid family intramembrane serine protease [Phenylobacterium deserti]|nr:rhomboid family intramembrane serine protease [Phenylobacterium deserti]